MIWVLLAAAVAAGDLWIKKWIREHKDLNSREPIAGGRIILTKYYNTGAMLGFLKEKTKLLAGGTLVALGIIIGLLLSVLGRKGNYLMKLGLSILLGGAASNIFERFAYGKVTDYFRVSIGCKKLEKVVFNIGDFCIFVGCVLTTIGSMLRK
ncbi:signal peptidase II [Catenibacillus scindens]|uniref:signal peptidase II n=1 Tax=Catenibacillus scindens TaxID=673271 RepID=UPI00320B8A1B